ncbi:MAG2960 family serine endopeptidase lipoprotein [Mesomycoplasma dispar]|uniref:Lipoprotein n=1 Tax=Mesomycoplasma dispar TaxID=86660 RepID=A0ABN5DRY9_9BACT|nr:lipoprotein [Mesomycoplasma dispar]ATP59954.1 lipoprotein [Mesomycoplasma dispar]
MKRLTKIIVSFITFSFSITLFTACVTKETKKDENNKILNAKIENLFQIPLESIDWKNIIFDYDKNKYRLEKLNLTKNFQDNQLIAEVSLIDLEKQVAIPKTFLFNSFLKIQNDKNELKNLQKVQDIQQKTKQEEIKKRVEKQVKKPAKPPKIPEKVRNDTKKNLDSSKTIFRPKPDFSQNLKKQTPKYQDSTPNFEPLSPKIISNNFHSVNYNSKNYNHLFNQNPKLKYVNKIYTESQNPEYFRDDHYFDKNFLLEKSAFEIIQSTPKYQTGVHNLYTFLYTGEHNQPINFLEPNDENRNRKFWEYTKYIGHYGDFGKNNDEKLMFYNRDLSHKGMIEQVYLPKFNSSESSSVTENKEDISEIVSKNPFGFLPSNLSQLFYYMKLEEIAKIFKISNLKSAKANFDDKKGEIEILLETKDDKKYLWKSSGNSNSGLKRDFDFQKYIYDRSFTLGIRVYKWHDDPFFSENDGLRGEEESGTAWVLDRIVNENDTENYELLVATNIHVFNLRRVFDKSLYFDIDSKNPKSAQWNAGFIDENNHFISEKDVKNKQSKVYFNAGRLQNPLSENKNTQNGVKVFPVFDAYESYLSGPYYTPRYKVSGLMGNDVDVGYKFLDNYNETTRVGTTKNGGADFVILRLKIKKTDLDKILPELKKVIETDKEKDWYVGLGKNEKFSPIKTQFYGGYPVASQDNETVEWNKGLNFKTNKSTGGIINTRSRIITDSLFQPLWVPYNESENKDWNSKHQNWKKYQKPFRDDLKHGMLKLILNQHSHLYTKIKPKDKLNALSSGSSGSMAIDSSFNLIGINFFYSKDPSSNTFSNAISLMEGESTYEDGFNGNIREDFKRKLEKDNLFTVKIRPKS